MTIVAALRPSPQPDGAQTRHVYINRETHIYDAKGAHSYTVDTVDGQVDSRYEDDPNSLNWLTTYFGYGPFGETTKIAAPDKTSQTMHYDPLGRRDRETSTQQWYHHHHL